MRALFLAAALALPGAATAADSYPEARAIVSVGGPVTEIIHALGAGDRIIARDTTSLYPPALAALPDVGYMRRLSAEGVLSVAPDLIVTRDTAGPPEVLDQLRAAAIPIVEVHDAYSPDGVSAAVRTVGAALGKEAAAEALVGEIEAQFAELAGMVAAQDSTPRVLFILSNQAGRLNVAGAGTGADGAITLAGGRNVMGAAFQGYKIMNDEALIEAAPEVVVMMVSRADHAADPAEIFALPALSQSPAARNGAFLAIDPATLSFGPRAPLLLIDFAKALQGAGQS